MWQDMEKRQKQKEVERLLWRLLNQSAPQMLPSGRETRADNRRFHTRPIMVATDIDGRCATEEAVLALSGDVCGHGMSAYGAFPAQMGKVYVGVWFDDQAQIFLGEVRNVVAIGAGLSRICLELAEIAPPDAAGMATMRVLSSKLRKPQNTTKPGRFSDSLPRP